MPGHAERFLQSLKSSLERSRLKTLNVNKPIDVNKI